MSSPIGRIIPLEDYNDSQPSAVALGFFDGIHRGHQRLLEETKSLAQSLGLRPLVFTFREHPSWLLRPSNPVSLLMSTEERLRLLSQAGFTCVVASFNRFLAQMRPEEFASAILAHRLQARWLVVGDNFHFGAGAQGGAQSLEEVGEYLNFQVRVLARLALKNRVVSSTWLRKLVREGRLQEAFPFWGRRFQVAGRIERGQQLGRQLGIPTANISPWPQLIAPKRGVYAARASLAEYPGVFPALAYWGNRPTFRGEGDILEVSILTPEPLWGPDELYGCQLTTDLYAYLRPQIKFPNTQGFIEQVAHDRQRVGKILAKC